MKVRVLSIHTQHAISQTEHPFPTSNDIGASRHIPSPSDSGTTQTRPAYCDCPNGSSTDKRQQSIASPD